MMLVVARPGPVTVPVAVATAVGVGGADLDLDPFHCHRHPHDQRADVAADVEQDGTLPGVRVLDHLAHHGHQPLSTVPGIVW
jgi:hypothetical protein